jgi:hypothetical protein
MKKDIGDLKSIRIYKSDWKEIQYMCVEKNITQPDVIHQLLHKFKSKQN